MIFDKIRLAGPTNVDLPLRGAQSTDPYLVKDIDGLGASDVDVNIKRTLNRGGIMQSLRPRNKELDILIKLNPNYSAGQTPADLRDAIYMFLAPVMNKPIKVQFMNESDVVCEIEGFLSRVTPNPFSKDPEIQVNVACLQPYFSAPALVNMGFNEGWAPAPNYTFDLPLVRGTAPAPFGLSVTFPSVAYTFRMYHFGNNGADQTFFIPGTFAAGTTLVINGVPGLKVARLDTPSLPSVDQMGNIGVGSVWLELYPGANRLVFDQTVQIDNLYYYPKFQGV